MAFALAPIGVLAMTIALAVTPASREELLNLGVALSRSICGGVAPSRVHPSPNPHVAGVVDHVEVRSCEAGESEILTRAGPEPRELPLSVVVYSADAPLPLPIRVGARLDGVEAFLGRPVTTSGDRQSYSLSESDDIIVIESRDGVIISVSWHFYSG
jgi:hypothetical protein